MLPFLKPQKQQSGGVITEVRKPDGSLNEKSDEQDQGLIAAAEDIMKAINSKDSKQLAAAIKAAFEICDSEPNSEYAHDANESEE